MYQWRNICESGSKRIVANGNEMWRKPSSQAYGWQLTRRLAQ